VLRIPLTQHSGILISWLLGVSARILDNVQRWLPMAWRSFSPFVETQGMLLGHGKAFVTVSFTLLSSGLRTHPWIPSLSKLLSCLPSWSWNRNCPNDPLYQFYLPNSGCILLKLCHQQERSPSIIGGFCFCFVSSLMTFCPWVKIQHQILLYCHQFLRWRHQGCPQKTGRRKPNNFNLCSPI
jgi:hypothetical protein